VESTPNKTNKGVIHAAGVNPTKVKTTIDRLDSDNEDKSDVIDTFVDGTNKEKAISLSSDSESDVDENHDSESHNNINLAKKKWDMQKINDTDNKLIEIAVTSDRVEGAIVQRNGNMSVQVRSLNSLLPGVWLNDEIMDFYYHLLQKKYHSADGTNGGYLFYNSHFLNKLMCKGFDGGQNGNVSYDYESVKRWSDKRGKKNVISNLMIYILYLYIYILYIYFFLDTTDLFPKRDYSIIRGEKYIPA